MGYILAAQGLVVKYVDAAKVRIASPQYSPLPSIPCELELEPIQTQMAQKPILRAEVYARALRASQNVKQAEVWVGARCA